MNKGGHLLVGFIVGILFIYVTHYFLGWFVYELKDIGIYALIITIYSLLPDSDHRNSIISFAFIGFSILGMIIGYSYNNNLILFSFFALLVVTFIAWMIGHRGFIHSIVFDVLVSIPLIYFFSYPTAILAFFCFYSHLCADKLWLKLV